MSRGLGDVYKRQKAESIKSTLESVTGYAADDIIVLKASGLNSLYASNGGIIVSFEK